MVRDAGSQKQSSDGIEKADSCVSCANEERRKREGKEKEKVIGTEYVDENKK